MKPEINKLDYSSYRVPYIEEFIPGFEYEYVYGVLVENRTPIDKLCKVLVGSTILKAQIIDSNKNNETIHVKFLEPGHNASYMRVMGYSYNPINNEDTKIPMQNVYAFKGFEQPYKWYTPKRYFWKKG
ncbi:unnamed protein product, partial [marine sediment metagenome]